MNDIILYELEKSNLPSLENEKTEILIQNATNYKKVHEIRIYLKELEEKSKGKLEKTINTTNIYIGDMKKQIKYTLYSINYSNFIP